MARFSSFKLPAICFLLQIAAITATFAGFSVDPSKVKATGIQLGQESKIIGITGNGNYFLSVTNTESAPSNYKMEILSCKQYKCDPYPGYEEIPDVKWIKVKSTVITVQGGQTGYIKDVSLKIPKKKQYYGKRYQAVVKVTKNTSPGQAINLEIVLPLWIETEKK